jgi:hypothetical protein
MAAKNCLNNKMNLVSVPQSFGNTFRTGADENPINQVTQLELTSKQSEPKNGVIDDSLKQPKPDLICTFFHPHG